MKHTAVCIASTRENNLTIFGVGTDKQIYCKRWDGNRWLPSPHEWQPLGGEVSSAPAALVEPTPLGSLDQIDVFVLGIDYQMYHKAISGSAWPPSTQEWEPLGGVFTSPPLVASWGPNRMDIVGLGTDNGMYHKAWDGSQWRPSRTDWEPLGGIFIYEPAIVATVYILPAPSPHQLDIFGVGTDKQMYHKAWDGTKWLPSPTDWEPIGGRFNGPPAAASWGPGRLDIFALGTDNQMYHKAWDGSRWLPSQTDWDPLGGVFDSSPAVVSWGLNRLDVFALGTDDQMYHKAWDGNNWLPSQTDWDPLGGVFDSSPAVVSWGLNRLDVFALATDDQMYHKAWDGNNWLPSQTEWEPLGFFDAPIYWEFLGPVNYAGTQEPSGAFPVSGRVNAVAFDPNTPGVWYLGAPYGGVWKTTDFGNSWNPIFDASVSSIAVDPSNSNTVYVGTGDIPTVGGSPTGLVKSDDGGQTWSQIGSAFFGNNAISKVIVDPLNPDSVLVGLFPGYVWRSADRGRTWHSTIEVQTWWLSIEHGATGLGGQLRYTYAVGEGIGTELHRSIDGGTTWTKLSNTPCAQVFQQRPMIACSPVDPHSVYLYSNTDKRVFASSDAGLSWRDVTGDWPDGGDTTYTFCFACSSVVIEGAGIQDVLYVGTYAVDRSVGANGRWTEVEGNVLGHADQHAIAVDPFDRNSLLIGNDGGVYRATFSTVGIASVFSLNKSLEITQVYRADYSPSDPPFVLAGTQDVATAASIGDLNIWRMVGGGDGGSCVINPVQPSIQYLMTNFDSNQAQLQRTTDAWSTWTDIKYSGMTSEPRALTTPMTLDPNDPSKLYIATNFLYRWNEPDGRWDVRLGSAQLSKNGAVYSIAVAKGDSDRLYTGSSQNELYMSIDAGLSWRAIDSGLPRGAGISAISIHPADPNDILVAMLGADGTSGRLWHCANTLATPIQWQDVSGNGLPTPLPDGPVYAIARDPSHPENSWFVGTNVGVFLTKTGGNQWSNPGPLRLPRIPVFDLKIILAAGQYTMYAATFGRGIWRARL
jgi:hypothetical protein